MGRLDYETETLLPMRRGGFFDGAEPIWKHGRFHCELCKTNFGVNDYDSNSVTCPKCKNTGIETIRDYLQDGGSIELEAPRVTHALTANGFDASEDGTGRGTPIVPCAIQAGALRENPESGPDGVGVRSDGVAYTLEARAEVQAVAFPCAVGHLNGTDVQDGRDIANSLSAGNAKQPDTVLAFSCKDAGLDAGPISPTLRSMGHAQSHQNGGGQVAVAFNWNAQVDQMTFDPHTTPALTRSQEAAIGPVGALAIRGRPDGSSCEARYDGTSNAILTPSGGRGGIGVGAIHVNMAVRRLTPKECERLQGFPDGWTDIPVGKKNKPAADGPRYKALGNSMAVPCMRWIGRRIAEVDARHRVMEVDFDAPAPPVVSEIMEVDFT